MYVMTWRNNIPVNEWDLTMFYTLISLLETYEGNDNQYIICILFDFSVNCVTSHELNWSVVSLWPNQIVFFDCWLKVLIFVL